MLDPQSANTHSQAGRWRRFTVSTEMKIQFLPDLPTPGEQGVPNVELSVWLAAIVPSATPANFVSQLNQLFNAIPETDEAKRLINSFGGDIWITTHSRVKAEWSRTRQSGKLLSQGQQ